MSTTRRIVAPGKTSSQALDIDLSDDSGDDSVSDAEEEEDPVPTLRPYQRWAVDAVKSGMRRGLTRLGLSAPTGSGKTIIFATIIVEVLQKSPKRKGKGKGKALVLVGSEEQAKQAKIKIQDAYGNSRIDIGMERNSLRAESRDQVIIATYQTLGKPARMEEFKRRFKIADFKLVIVDEAHHSVANTYLRILSEFNDEVQLNIKAQTKKSNISHVRPTHGLKIPIVGVSATFKRHDDRELGWVYQEVVYKCSLEELWEAGHLVPVRVWKLSQEPRDTAGPSGGRLKICETLSPCSNRRARSSAGQQSKLAQLTVKELNYLTGTRKFNEQVLKYYQARAQGRKSTLIFSSDLAHVDDLCSVFTAVQIQARFVTSKTPKTKRGDILATFDRGEFPVLVTCLALSEGLDIPSLTALIDCIVLANPTDSQIRHTQMVGRATRLSPKTGKIDCLVIDLVGNCDRFPLGVGPNLKRKSDEDRT